ncbi:MAG: ABC transporter substrate-binding protein [Lachnospiraceae bacterium]|nr:ABC transporter substrate-binding protein [Lachnospiraceae bacterium]
MKKTLAMLLTAMMLLSLTACGSSSSSTSSSTSSSEDSASTSAGESTAEETTSGELVTVTIVMPTMNNIPADSDVADVENALSEYIQGLGYNININMEMAALSDYTTTMNLRLAGGEVLDIIYTGALSTAVTNGYLVNLDEYLDDELAETMEVIGDWSLCGTIDGSVYGIPAYKGLSLDYKYIYNEEYFADIDMSGVSSVNDLDDIFAQFKALYPDEYPATDGYNTLLALFSEEDHTAAVGTYLATVGDSTELVSLYSTEAYKNACEKTYEWRQNGYVDPEGSAQTLSHDALSLSGYSKGVIMGHAYSVETIEEMYNTNNTYGGTFKAISIAQTSLTSNTLTYGIAYTSENPSEAAQVLNLIWTDEYVMSTLIYGLEGISWEWNEDQTSIQYPDGLGLDSVPYTALYSCGAFGNQFLLYGFDGNTSEEDKVFMKELIDEAYVAPLFGFTPSSDNVSTQVAAVSNVVSQYDSALRYGDVDPDVYLPQFLEALEAAGIQDIIDEYQAQADAWVAEYK